MYFIKKNNSVKKDFWPWIIYYSKDGIHDFKLVRGLRNWKTAKLDLKYLQTYNDIVPSYSEGPVHRLTCFGDKNGGLWNKRDKND